MKVTVVDPSAYTPPYDACFCNALAEAGAEVELATSKFVYGSEPGLSGFKRDYRFYRTATGLLRNAPPKMRAAVKLIEHPFDMASLIRRSKRRHADLVHFQWLAVQPIDRYFLRRIKRPKVLTAHDVVPREPRPGQLRSLRSIYSTVDALIVHSRHSRDRLVGELGVEPTKIAVIPHGSFDYLNQIENPTPMDPAVGDLEGKKVVLFFGLLRPYKGVDVLIDAFQKVDPDAVLLIVGMPRLPLEPLRQQVERNGLSDRVRFVPRFISDPEIPAYFTRADLVVLPYREIEQSGVLYTGLAFKKPMVVSDAGGFSEFAAENGAAELVPPGNANALGQKINQLLGDQVRLDQLSQSAQQASAQQYSWQDIAAKTIDLYGSLL